jgi:hypothetical protein
VIPRKLHFVWLGSKPVPEEWLVPWRALHPGWEVRLWREADLAKLPMLNRAHFDALMADECWHGAADIARYEILLDKGGVYVDIDSKPLRTFDGASFMDASFFAGYEPTQSMPGRVANGTIGAEQGHHVLRQLVELISEMTVVQPPWDTIGGTALTSVLTLHKYCECKPQILPARTFYATNAHGRPTPGKDQPYSEHFWATTNSAYTGRVVILVPRRAGDPVRDRAWEFVKERWSALDWPIIEGHHDDGLWNAAVARNAAAREAGDWDVAVFIDADTIPRDINAIREAVELAARSGSLVRPFRTYVNLDEDASKAVLETGSLPAMPRRPRRWEAGVKSLTDATGGIAIVPRRLWDAVGGYDERFKGWGSEDAAFSLACSVLGGLKLTNGEVWHLWHPLQERDPAAPQYKANVALRKRYESAHRRREQMRALVEEHRTDVGPFSVGLVIITNGRRDCIEATVASLKERVKPAFTERLICDDSGDPKFARWLQETFPDFVVYAHPHLGHGPAVAFARRRAAQMGTPWVFFSEDDYEFNRPIDLEAIARQMIEHPSVAQMVIRRQGWFPSEIEAGGMIERFDPGLFTERSQNGTTWIEHRQFYSLNPHLTRRSFIAAHPWPARPNSEHHFGRALFSRPNVSAGIWGAKGDEPWARHFGERVGSGY